MDRAKATEFARAAAAAHHGEHSYLEGDLAAFEPHPWVVDAIVASQPPMVQALCEGYEETIAGLRAKLALAEAAVPGIAAMEFIRSGIQMAALLARPVEEGGPENYMQVRIAWDVPLQGCPFQLVELAFVRAGGRGPHEMREHAEAGLAQVRAVLRLALTWLETAFKVDEVVEDVDDRNELRAVMRDVRGILAAPESKPVKVIPTGPELVRMARLLYEAPDKDGKPADHHVLWDDVPEDDMVHECMVNEARQAFALGARLP